MSRHRGVHCERIFRHPKQLCSMENIQTVYNRTDDLTTFKVVGKMIVPDFYDCLADYYEGSVTRFALWDLVEADFSAVDTVEISDLAEYAGLLAEVCKGGKTVIVSAGSCEFGLGRMFETYLEMAVWPFVNGI